MTDPFPAFGAVKLKIRHESRIARIAELVTVYFLNVSFEISTVQTPFVSAHFVQDSTISSNRVLTFLEKGLQTFPHYKSQSMENMHPKCRYGGGGRDITAGAIMHGDTTLSQSLSEPLRT